MGQSSRRVPWKPLAAGAVLVAAVVAAAWLVVSHLDSGQRLATSSDPAERLEAVAKLENEQGEPAWQTLRKLVADPDVNVARRAVRAIHDVPALREVFADRKLKGEIRAEAALGLAKEKADPAPLVAALDPKVEPDADARAGAAEALSVLRDHKTIPQLFAALEDPSPKVRLWAITAIHRMIVRRFPFFRAELPPDQQREQIEKIKAYLRQAKLL